MQFPPIRPTHAVNPLRRPAPAAEEAHKPAAKKQNSVVSEVQFAGLDTRRSQASQATPSTRNASTQVSDQNFRSPATQGVPAATNSAPVPVYHAIDHAATVETRRFHEQIRSARAMYGNQVRFTKLKDGDRTVGFILSARKALGADTVPALPERQRALYVAGSSGFSRNKTTFITSANIFTAAGDPAKPTALASELRREKTRLGQGNAYTGENSVVPNYYVGSGTLKAMEAALYVSNAGRSGSHTQPVDVFVAAPGQSVHLSTVMRSLPDGVYGGVIYGRH